MSEIEFTDRYQALGIPYPDPETMCLGQCEGTGIVPVHFSDDDPVFKALWLECHNRVCNPRGFLQNLWRAWLEQEWAFFWLTIKQGWRCDGWHFVTCPDCKGTRKRLH